MNCVSWAKSHWVQALSFVITSVLLVFITTMTWGTLVVDHPFHAREDRAAIRHDVDGRVVFQYWRTLEIRERMLGRVSRYVAHSPTGKTVELGMSEQLYEPGVKSVYREFPLGWTKDVEGGEWCLTAVLSYQPTFSIVQHHYDAPKVCAIHDK